MTALLIYPTHQNCREARDQFEAAGIEAVCYPARRTEPSEHEPQNCWNPNADLAERMGLVVMAAVCPDCPERNHCEGAGYLQQRLEADEAFVSLGTHARAEHSGLGSFASGRKYVSIHEDPIKILRPKSELTEADLQVVQTVLQYLLHDPAFLKLFADTLRIDDEGNKYVDEELALRLQRQHEFCEHLSDMVQQLLTAVNTADRTQEWTSPVKNQQPDGIERILFLASRIKGVTFAGQPWRFVLAAGAGEIHSAAILVSRRHRPSGSEPSMVVTKRVVGFSDNRPPASAVTWFNDATTEADRLEAILGRPVEDQTPDGHLLLRKKAVQVLRDITRSTTGPTLLKILRGVLADRPQFQRIGIICHQVHRKVIDEIEPEFLRRIVKIAHFGSGEDRSSNAWAKVCDLILIVGTPRVPPDVVATYLVQIGEIGAACRAPAWGKIVWNGRTESGESIQVTSCGYRDEAWRRAHRDLVRAALVQAVGRGRGILESGCEVLLLSNEQCGVPISDGKLEVLNATSQKLLEALRRLSLENPNNILALSSVSTSRLAREAGISDPRARAVLNELEARGHVRKIGERGGWMPVFSSDRAVDPIIGNEDAQASENHTSEFVQLNASRECGELHIQPDQWECRETRLHCPVCGKFMGYASNQQEKERRWL